MLYLISGNGEPNFGDELIVMEWINYYRRNGYSGTIFVDCKSGSGARRLHTSDSDVRFGRFLKSMAVGKEGSIADHIKSGRAFVNHVLGGPDLDDPRGTIARVGSIAEDDRPPADLATARLVHLVGGGYINGAWRNSFSLLGAASQMARMVGCPVVASGLGLAPLNMLTSEDAVELFNAIDSFEIFEVRDDKSYLLLNSVSSSKLVSVGLDDSFLSQVKVKSEFHGRSLHLCLFGRHTTGEYGSALLDQIKVFSKGFDRVVAWRCNVADEEACARAEVLMPSLKRMYNRTLLYGGLPIGQDDYMITSRFHPHLLAARTGIDGSYLVQSDFYDSKHRSVAELGSRFHLYDGELGLKRNPTLSAMPRLDNERVAAKRAVGANILRLLG